MASAQDFKRTDFVIDSETQEEMKEGKTPSVMKVLNITASEAENKDKESDITSTPLKYYGKLESGKVVARLSVKRAALVSPDVSPSGVSKQPSMKKSLTAVTLSPTKSIWSLQNPFRTAKKEIEEMVEVDEEVQEEDSVKVDVSKD